MSKRNICAVTGSRADYGLLQPLLRRLKSDSNINFELIVTGSHLSKKFGNTYKEIIKDGFRISRKLNILNGSDDSVLRIVDAKAIALKGFARTFKQLKPDVVVLLGDRYEVHAAAEAALFLKIPIAHIAGGDITEGAFDNALRHSISKMAHLHFTTCDESARRVMQLGEDERYVFTVGHLGIDQIRNVKLLNRIKLERRLNFKFLKRNILVTFHPETLGKDAPLDQAKELLISLSKLEKNVGIIFTKSNADPEGLKISYLIDSFTRSHPNSKAFTSLGQQVYLSVMSQVDAVVGNSSSGIYEAPSYKIPTVNIGDRQKGRLCSASVIHCSAEASAIDSAIRKAFQMNCAKIVNPYGDGKTADRIYRLLRTIPDFQILIKKRFLNRGELDVSKKHVYVIAEIGVNHNGSLELAKRLIHAASKAGADAVKFQSFIAEEMVSSGAKKAVYQLRHTDPKQSQLAMLKKLELNQDAHLFLKKYCSKLGIEFLSTPFDSPSLKMLVKVLNVTTLKIPSGEITNAPFLLEIARTGLPLIVSTGMADLKEVEQALQMIAYGYIGNRSIFPSLQLREEVFRSTLAGEVLKQKVILLQCTTEYPTPFYDVNLRAMNTLCDQFNLRVGLSDHSKGWAASLAAVGRGACVIEKHFTLNRLLKGPDHAASLTPDEFSTMVKAIREIEEELGSSVKKPAPSEIANRLIARKSIVARHAIRKGDVFSCSNLTTKRPGTGESPFRWLEFMGRKASRSFKRDESVVL